MPLLNLVDITECTRGPDSEIVLFGRLDTGETASVFVSGLEHYIYLAAAPEWCADDLRDDLDRYLLRRNTYARCTRTLCPCRKCPRCGRDPCACPCRTCGQVACVCHCKRCNKAPCECEAITQVAINSEPCVQYRKQDEEAVLGVEAVSARGLLGYEEDERLFYKIRLARAQYTPDARKYLNELDTLLPARYRGSYESTPSAIDSFMRQKGATGFCWLDVAGEAVPERYRRTRCAVEYNARWRDVNVHAGGGNPPALTRMTLDCEMLAQKWTQNDPICMVSVRCGGKRVLHVASLDPIGDMYAPIVGLDELDDAPVVAEEEEEAAPWVRKEDEEEACAAQAAAEPYEVEQFADEKAMLEAICRRIRDEDPDILCGYNIARFDLPRILKRCQERGVDADFSRFIGQEVRAARSPRLLTLA